MNNVSVYEQQNSNNSVKNLRIKRGSSPCHIRTIDSKLDIRLVDDNSVTGGAIDLEIIDDIKQTEQD